MKETGGESSSSPSGKRSRDAEDEVYLDNFHSHKRYLSEVMASSLNGLTVGDSLPETLMESPARSEGTCNPRDEISLQYSPMSEDLDDIQYSETALNTSLAQPDSLPTSPVSPHRHQRPLSGLSSTTPTSYPSHSCSLTAMSYSQPRQRGSDSEGRIPSSPSDLCHSADLRKTALLRSVQMRTQPPGSPVLDMPLSLMGEPMQNIEAEELPSSCVKPLDEREYQNPEQVPSLFMEECSSMELLGSELSREKPCRALDMNVKGEESGEGVFGGNGFGRTSLMSSRRSGLGGDGKACIDLK